MSHPLLHEDWQCSTIPLGSNDYGLASNLLPAMQKKIIHMIIFCRFSYFFSMVPWTEIYECFHQVLSNCICLKFCHSNARNREKKSFGSNKKFVFFINWEVSRFLFVNSMIKWSVKGKKSKTKFGILLPKLFWPIVRKIVLVFSLVYLLLHPSTISDLFRTAISNWRIFNEFLLLLDLRVLFFFWQLSENDPMRLLDCIFLTNVYPWWFSSISPPFWVKSFLENWRIFATFRFGAFMICR